MQERSLALLRHSRRCLRAFFPRLRESLRSLRVSRASYEALDASTSAYDRVATMREFISGLCDTCV